MDHADAQKLNHLLLKISADLDQSTAYVRDRSDQEEFKDYRKAVGRCMGCLYLEVMEPLWKKFPELRPKHGGGSYEIPNDVYEPRFYRGATDQDPSE